MAINRIWYPNAPANGVAKADRAQLAVGYPMSGTAVTDTVDVQAEFNENYFRLFINDMPTKGSV